MYRKGNKFKNYYCCIELDIINGADVDVEKLIKSRTQTEPVNKIKFKISSK